MKDDDQIIWINWIKGLLNDENVKNLRITFTKVSGEERTIHCTTTESRIPEDRRPKGTGREASAETQRVFDLDLQDWRSFRWDSVKGVKFSLGENNDQRDSCVRHSLADSGECSAEPAQNC